MGIVTSLRRVSDDKLNELSADPSGINEYLFGVDHDGPTGYLDKSIDALQELLTAAAVPVWIAPVEMPGQPIDRGRSQICFGLSSKKVAEVATNLRGITFDALAAHSAADANELDYLRIHYENLVRFVDDASSRGLGAILTHG